MKSDTPITDAAQKTCATDRDLLKAMRKMERELIEARKDSERLDWLEKSESFPALSQWTLLPGERNYSVTLVEHGGCTQAPSIRQAIDAAIAQEGKNE